MEHRFAGHSYTIGIEEELMILDAESFELVTRSRRYLSPRRWARSSPS
jgi:gamma-glutamyl:cysteine ligase YbdK (ATP-grasp superfamily)